ncbi:Asp-tRNA(Asn)/Glu-tRNA(Gln) amidotransferase subunit GatB [Patescibacteria group bacterium]|nr:Asp-tRNA(Asn)/Glu-tRNA(Gln) amidotransferase subunit GatB [Patescibacteria group bacterium]
MPFDLKPVIGLEIHLVLNTKSKLFCSCLNQAEETRPNFNICPVCWGQPGVLPVLNQEAVRKVILLGLALKGKVADEFWFDRKNYFYPDLPKGYQISQFYRPLISGGFLEINGQKINLERVHLEEDTAKFWHQAGGESFLDFNRAGLPLAEIVTKPELESPEQVRSFLQELQEIVQAFEISEAKMEAGQMRCDLNVSLRPEKEKEKLYPKTEIKNLNSFRAAERALLYEIKRQSKLWLDHKDLLETTRGWDAEKEITVAQRSKEEVKDYRYFPEPDLPIFSLTKDDFPFRVQDLEKSLPDLPSQQRKYWQDKYDLSEDKVRVLFSSPQRSSFIQETIDGLKDWIVDQGEIEGSQEEIWQISRKKLISLVANWFLNYYLVFLEECSQKEDAVSVEDFIDFLVLLYQKKMSNHLGRKILLAMIKTSRPPKELMEEEKKKDSPVKQDLSLILDELIKSNPLLIEKIKSGQENVIHFLIGQAVKKTKGRVNPGRIKDLLKKKLEL